MKILLTILLLAINMFAATPTPVQTPQSEVTPDTLHVISGQVVYADTSRPVPNAFVVATSGRGNVFTTTDENGIYALTGFVPGESYTVVVNKNAEPNVAISSFDSFLG